MHKFRTLCTENDEDETIKKLILLTEFSIYHDIVPMYQIKEDTLKPSNDLVGVIE
jgi:hypothetical protein